VFLRLIDIIAQRLQISAAQVAQLKRSPCSSMRQHYAAVCAHLRVSAVNQYIAQRLQYLAEQVVRTNDYPQLNAPALRCCPRPSASVCG